MSTGQTRVRARPGAALAAATIMSLPLGSLYAFSVLLAPLEQILQATRSELAGVFGISAVFFTIGANLAPRLFGRIPAPLLVALTGALASVGVALAAVAPSLSWLILGYGVLFATGGGMAYVAVQQCVNAAPLARPGLVNGYLVSLFPLGAMLAAPAFGLGIDWVGVRQTLAGLAAVIAATGIVATLFVAYAGVVLAKTGRPTALQAAGSQDSLRATFWKLFTVFFLAASAGLMVLSQAAGMVAAFGAGKTASLLATTGITAAIAAARLAGGWLVDRLPVPIVAASALTVMPSPEVAILTLALIGVGYGLVSGVTAGAVASYWPKVEFGRIASRTYIAWCLAAISLPVLAGRLYELTGGYETAVIVAGGANLLAVLVALTLPRQKRAP
ncbi:MAG: OFA family MFS transporter [Alphaproteobacteria bacterium]|nr:MAG: OFA family MFS transporter [Alphaproteobacteria bacterium]